MTPFSMNKLENLNIIVPILLIGFNRPDVIRESLNFIRAAKPAVLYFAIDQARDGIIGELELVNEVKEIVRNVDWECRVSYKFNESNLGAERTVSSAVSWVLDLEDTVIVLEDDIIAPMSFLHFAQDMLERYKDSADIYMISSNQFTPFRMDTDYTFSIYGHSNGWATWKRAWDNFDLNTGVSNEYLEILDDEYNKFSITERIFLVNRFEKMESYGRGKASWDLCWFYIRFINKGLTIVPKRNLSCNIGVYGLHATGICETHFREYDENFVCRNHPIGIRRNVEYDYHHFRTYMEENPNVLRRILVRLQKTLRIDILLLSLKRMSYEAKKKKILNL